MSVLRSNICLNNERTEWLMLLYVYSYVYYRAHYCSCIILFQIICCVTTLFE